MNNLQNSQTNKDYPAQSIDLALEGCQIPKEDLEVGAYYIGKGRNGNVGFWDGEDFLVIGLSGRKVGPSRSDWQKEYCIKREPYYTADEGCFQPFTKLITTSP